MLKTFLLLVCAFTSGIYNISFQQINGNPNPTSFNDYQGKKILIVNIATGSQKISQLAGLQQLYERYSDSLVIIAFPSNSFGNEAMSNNLIKSFCQDNYHITFPIAAKGDVNGPGIQPTYSWLANPSANGVIAGTVRTDFQKFLISKTGEFIGVFSSSVQPTDSVIINAITDNY